jgi:outer membrane protein OmpA-like peptidoglycan-associated protein
MKNWSGLVGATLFASVLTSLSACGGPGSGGGCHYESWRGTCTLRGVRTEKIIERFPQSFVVVEATYEPVSKGGEFSPPPFNKRAMAPAEFEADLTAHFRKQSSVECAVDNPVGDACAPKMTAAVQEYVPPASAPVATGPVGCAKIEHQEGAPAVPASAVLPGPFQFDANSSAESDDIRKLADEAAQKILHDPHIECVAIRGNSAPGEDFTLANDRAQKVKRLLLARGIDPSRVTVFEATAPSYTASPDDQPVLAEHRRVHLSVVVYGQATGAH